MAVISSFSHSGCLVEHDPNERRELEDITTIHSLVMGRLPLTAYFWDSLRRLMYSGTQGSLYHQLVILVWRAMKLMVSRPLLRLARWLTSSFAANLL